MIDFKNMHILLKEIEKEIENKKLEQKVLVKYEDSLRSIINGLKKNKSLEIEEVLVVSHQLIEKALVNMQIKSDKEEFFDSTLVNNNVNLKKFNKSKRYEL